MIAAVMARGIGMTGAFALSVAVLRSLSPADAGVVLLVYTLLTIGATVARLGSDTYTMRDAARDRATAGTIVRQSARLCLRLGPLVGVLLVAAILLQGRDASLLPVALIAGAGVTPAALAIVAGATLRGLGRMVVGTLAELASPTWIPAAGVFVLASTGHANPATCVLMIVCGNAVTAIWAWAVVRRVLPQPRHPLEPFRSFLTRERAVLWGFTAAALGSFLFAWMPVIVLAYVTADPAMAQHDVAVYNAGARPAQFVSVLALMQASYLGPATARLYHAGDIAGVVAIVKRATVVALAWGAVLTAAIVAAPGLVLSVFGGYDAAAPILVTLSIGALLALLLGPAGQIMLVSGQEQMAGRFTVITLASSALGLSVLTLWGPVAVAAGAACAAIGYAVACRRRLRHIGIRLWPSLPG